MSSQALAASRYLEVWEKFLLEVRSLNSMTPVHRVGKMQYKPYAKPFSPDASFLSFNHTQLF